MAGACNGDYCRGVCHRHKQLQPLIKTNNLGGRQNSEAHPQLQQETVVISLSKVVFKH